LKRAVEQYGGLGVGQQSGLRHADADNIPVAFWIAAHGLASNPHASEQEIRRGLSGLKCRCGTHMSILRAVRLAQARLGTARTA